MNINEEIKKVMVAGIDEVLGGKLKEFESDLPIWPELAEGHLEGLGYEKGDFDTNGWQYDWWMTFTKDDKSFTACGHGYYGGFEFAPTEE